MMNPSMKPGALGMGGRGLPGASAGPKMSTIPMSMPMSGAMSGGGPKGSPAFMPGPGAMGSGGGGAGASMDAGRAASSQNYLSNARAQHQQAQQASLDATRAKAGQLGLPGGSQAGSGPKGAGIVPAVGMMPGGGSRRLSMPAGGGFTSILSDAESKKKIRELEGVNDHYRSLLGGDDEASYPTPRAPDTSAMDAAYRAPSTSSYEYRDPSAPGAASGRQVGPMAHELEGIPGVVAPGPDGMKRVDPGRLTMANTSQLAQQRRELDELKAHLDSLGSPDEKLSYASGR